MEAPTRPEPAPTRNDPCLCGSGKRFKHCCGASGPDRPVPRQIHIVEDFVARTECEELLAFAAQQQAERLKLVDLEKTTEEQVVRKFDDSRVTLRVQVRARQAELNALVERAASELIAPAFECSFDWYEEPQLLRYEPGGFYHTHADSESFDEERDCWVKVVDRDVSMLIYLDDDYTGGELRFERFDFQLRPRPGTLVFFPSDCRYLHTALQVTSGVRHALVSWLSRQDVAKLRPPPQEAIAFDAAG